MGVGEKKKVIQECGREEQDSERVQRSEFDLHCCLRHKSPTEGEAKASYVKFDVLFLVERLLVHGV